MTPIQIGPWGSEFIHDPNFFSQNLWRIGLWFQNGFICENWPLSLEIMLFRKYLKKTCVLLPKGLNSRKKMMLLKGSPYCFFVKKNIYYLFRIGLEWRKFFGKKKLGKIEKRPLKSLFCDPNIRPLGSKTQGFF